MPTMKEAEKQEIIERNKYYNQMNYEDKIDIATQRVVEWAEICADAGKNYAVSVGGLDSIVLLTFVRGILGKDTRGISVSGLEDPSIQKIHRQLGVEVIKPGMNFSEVLNTVGFPVYSKQIAKDLEHLQIPQKDADFRKQYYNHALMTGETGPWGGFKQSEGMKMPDDLLEKFGGEWGDHRPDLCCKCAPFKVSAQCCEIMKEEPSRRYQEEHNIYPFLGLMQVEGGQRRFSLRRYGCNYVGKGTARSCPFNYFSRQDLLTLALDLKVPIPEIYGEIVMDENGKLRTTKAQRTGCVICGFGLHLESRPHRFDRLYMRNPKGWEYWMNSCCMDEDGTKYGWGRVCDYIGVEWRDPEHWWLHKGQVEGQMNIYDYLEA